MGLKDRLMGAVAGRAGTPFSGTPFTPGGSRATSLNEPALVFRPGLDSSQARWTVPVLEIAYYPLAGDRIDKRVTGDVDAPLADIQRHVQVTSDQVHMALEAGSARHRYKDANSQPAIRYETVDRLEFHQPIPTWNKPGHKVPMADYNAVMAQIDIEQWVGRGVKQVWIWAYHGGVIDMWESNMAGPHGDISNSDRDPHDLPVLDQTYTVYHYNYGRGPSEAVEDHMHQIEALLRTLDHELFWDKYVGKTGEGRCGWAHYPPNGVRDYDWQNTSPVLTDIEDWRPEGGERVRMDSRRWNRDSLTWFVYWMQNLPSANNGLSYRGRPISDWWHFVADLDDALARGMTL